MGRLCPSTLKGAKTQDNLQNEDLLKNIEKDK